MTDTMKDPIAAAAANLHDAAPCSTEPSVIQEIREDISELEAKLDHLIHPEAANEPQSAAGESGPVQSPMLSQGQSSSSSPLSSESASEQSASSPTSAAEPLASGDLPNAAASPAESHVVDASASSAQNVSQEGATPAPKPSGAIREHLQAIRAHLSLKGFEAETVAAIHGSLAEIEKLL